jgi:hypothetical protein
MKQMGLSVSAISELTGYDRKTVRKYLLNPEGVPDYGPRVAEPSKLDPHKPFLADRLKAGVWNAQVLLREIRQRGYGGGYTILKDWLHPQRTAACTAAVRRFETPPGKQDWGHPGDLEMAGAAHRIWGFTITLGYSRRMWAQAALDQKLGTLLRMHEGAFQGGGPPPGRLREPGGGRCAMTPIEQLQSALSTLGLKAVEARLEGLLEQAAKKEPSYAEFPEETLSCEVDARRTRYLRARLQLAHLPFVKTFEQFDFEFQPSIDEKQIRELRSLRFVHETSSVVFLGPPGVGKTHLSVALAEAAIQAGFGAYFITAHDMVADL